MAHFVIVEKFKEKYETVAEHAERKGISRQAVYKSLREGRLEGAMIGKVHYVLKG